MSSRRNREIIFLVSLCVGFLFARPALAPDEPYPGQFHSMCGALPKLTTVDGGEIVSTGVAGLHLDRHGQAVVLLNRSSGLGNPKILRVPPDSDCYRVGGVFPPRDAFEIKIGATEQRESYAEMAPSNPLTGSDHAVIVALEKNAGGMRSSGPADGSPINGPYLNFGGDDNPLWLAEVNFMVGGEVRQRGGPGFAVNPRRRENSGDDYNYELGDGSHMAVRGIGSWNDTLRAVAVQQDDGNVLLAGTSVRNVPRQGTADQVCEGNSYRCRVIMRNLSRRYPPAAESWIIRVRRDDLHTLDSSFGTAGRTILDRSLSEGGADYYYDGGVPGMNEAELSYRGGGWHIGIQPDSKIVVQRGSVLQRLNSDGPIDYSFGGVGDGTVRLPIAANDMTILPSGKILVAGSYSSSPSSDRKIAVALFNADGTPDLGFGFLGVTVVTGRGRIYPSEAKAIAVDPWGRILACGVQIEFPFSSTGEAIRTDPSSRMTLARFNPNGDEEFSLVGRESSYELFSSVSDCVVEEDGMILVAGSYNHHSGDRWGKVMVTEEALLARWVGRSPPGNIIPDVIRRSRSHPQRSVGPGNPPSTR